MGDQCLEVFGNGIGNWGGYGIYRIWGTSLTISSPDVTVAQGTNRGRGSDLL